MAITDKKRKRANSVFWVVTCLSLIMINVALSFLSHHFIYGRNFLERPHLLVVALLCFAGIIYMAAVLWVRHFPSSKSTFFLLLLVGLVLRLTMLPSLPIQEDDFYRYLWDGAVTAHGFNPYAYAPAEIIGDFYKDVIVAEELNKLASQSFFQGGPTLVVERINYANIKSIYPLVAQFFFALAHVIKPWSLISWRLLLFALDLIVVWQLTRLASLLKLPLAVVLVYWWNPLLVKEIYNSGHMDLIVLPFLLAAVHCLISNKYQVATLFLALAVGSKIWPILLFPYFLHSMRSLKQQTFSLLLMSLLLAFFAFPFCVAGLTVNSGIVQYSMNWQTNASIFALINWGIVGFRNLADLPLSDINIQFIARSIVLIIMILWICFLFRFPIKRPEDLIERILFTIAALFLLIPTQYPWYAVWFLPFLVFLPRPSLLLLFVLLPLYYLRFYFGYRNNEQIFETVIVWLEFLPVWALILYEGRNNLLKSVRKKVFTSTD
jgi:hypothetical protein